MKKMIAVWAAMLSTMCSPTPAPAAQLTPAQTYGIYVAAYGQYGGPREWLEHRNMPIIHLVTRAELCEQFDYRPDCPVKASYWPDIDSVALPGGPYPVAVFIDEALDFADPVIATVLLHEFIHHFQFLKAGRTATNCYEWRERELEAYRIQAHYLRKIGEHMAASRVERTARSLYCR